MIKQHVDVLFMDGELMLGDTLRLYKGDNGILISVKVEKQYYKNNKLITENLIELGKYGRAIIRKGQHDCPFHNEESEEPVYCSEVAKIKDGRLDILIPKEAIDETSEMGIYEIQIQLYGSLNEGERPRLTLDPFEFEACDLISEDLELEEPVFNDDPVVDSGLVGDAILREDGELPVKLEDGSFNKTEWKSKDVITAGRLNKMEDAMKTVYGIRAMGLAGGSLNKHIAIIINALVENPTLDTIIRTMIRGDVYVELSDGSQVLINEGLSNRSEAEISFLVVPNALVKKAKVKFSLTTNKALIIGDFTLNIGDEKAVLDNDKVHIIEGVDMTGMATEAYVLKAIDEIPEVDLSGYATKEELPSVEGLVSEEFVDEAISNIHTLEVKTIGNPDVMTLDGGDEYTEFDIDAELGSLMVGEEKHYVFKKTKITHIEGTIFFEDDFVSVKCTYSSDIGFIIYLNVVNSSLKYILNRNIIKKRTHLQETQTPSTMEYTMEHTMGVTTIGQEGIETEFNINLINLEKPNLNNFIFKGDVYIPVVVWDGNEHPVWFINCSVNISIMGPYDDGSFHFEVKDHLGRIVTFYVEPNGIVRLEGDIGAPVYPGDLEYMLPIKRWNNKTIANAYEFMDEPQLYLLNNVTIKMTDGSSYDFGRSPITATMYRADTTIYIYDHTNCREILLNCNGSSIDSTSVNRLFTSISNEFDVKQIGYPPADMFAGIRRVFGNTRSMRITPGFNALNDNGELTAFKFGKYFDSLVYYVHDFFNKKFTIYSYEEMKTYTFSYPSVADIPTLVSIESDIPTPDIDLTSYATKEYVDTAIENLGNFGGGDLSNYITREEFNSLSENVGSIETQLYDKVTMDAVRGELATYATKEELQNQLGNIDAILDAINGEII